MDNQIEILGLIKERIRVLNLFKNLYMKKQKSAVKPHLQETENLDDLHKNYLEEMMSIEEKWRVFISELREVKNIQSTSTDIIISLAYNDEIVTQYFAYKDRLAKILDEVERIKRNSTLIAKNALPFLQKELQNSAGNSEDKHTHRARETAVIRPLLHPQKKDEDK